MLISSLNASKPLEMSKVKSQTCRKVGARPQLSVLAALPLSPPRSLPRRPPLCRSSRGGAGGSVAPFAVGGAGAAPGRKMAVLGSLLPCLQGWLSVQPLAFYAVKVASTLLARN